MKAKQIHNSSWLPFEKSPRKGVSLGYPLKYTAKKESRVD